MCTYCVLCTHSLPLCTCKTQNKNQNIERKPVEKTEMEKPEHEENIVKEKDNVFNEETPRKIKKVEDTEHEEEERDREDNEEYEKEEEMNITRRVRGQQPHHQEECCCPNTFRR